MSYKIVERFVSINGEGQLTGQLAVFIRFAGCNLECSYCDTRWANDKGASYESMTKEEIYSYIKSTKVKNVTLTGGEPLFQNDIYELIEMLCLDDNLNIEIETNGSVDIKEFKRIKNNPPRFTIDYKLPSSGMEDKMLMDNYESVNISDTMKFVVGGTRDLIRAKSIIDEYRLIDKTRVYFSPVFGQISLEDIVDFMISNAMNGVSLQMQLHKIIWNPDKRGV